VVNIRCTISTFPFANTQPGIIGFTAYLDCWLDFDWYAITADYP